MILNHTPNTRNEYQDLIPNQKLAFFKSVQLESGVELGNVTIAYKTWGRLNAHGDNCLVICHALSGSADVADWWGPLLGPGRAFDTARYFIFCANVLGSPYGTTSPLSINPKTGRRYGPEFPQTCIRDDVRLHKFLLDALGVRSVAAVIGGSMGGMATLEWPLCTSAGYVKNIIPISTSVYHDAWGIAWAEAQRQCVFADPAYENGYYTTQPTAGLAAARMVGMLTYRSSASFGRRFGREGISPRKGELANGTKINGHLHHERRDSGISTCDATKTDTPKFKAQSYLHYQGQKFTNRFDANCFIHLTRKMDAHDITYHKIPSISPKALVIGISSDVLFRPEQQEEIARRLLDSKLVMVESEEGHDGFLLEFEKLGRLIEEFLRETYALVYEAPLEIEVEEIAEEIGDSVFGEVESEW